MNLFISWSGELAKAIARHLAWWVPYINQEIKPWVSDTDLVTGDRWFTEIGKQLQSSDVGIICVTKANTNRPWLNFEAGALAKSIDQSRIIPLLHGIHTTTLIDSPLSQFQSISLSKQGMAKLAKDLNSLCTEQRDDPAVTEIFETFWPLLNERIESLPRSSNSSHEEAVPASTPTEQEVLSKLLEISNDNARNITSIAKTMSLISRGDRSQNTSGSLLITENDALTLSSILRYLKESSKNKRINPASPRMINELESIVINILESNRPDISLRLSESLHRSTSQMLTRELVDLPLTDNDANSNPDDVPF